ncbi:MAG: DEAD/DEAH box helicase [Opitutales bacterium]|nr:DEAD/DEAH box helicase [Opitutales bacterium]
MAAKSANKITLYDKLSRLTYRQACLLLGGDKTGAQLLARGGRFEVAPEDVRLSADCLRVDFPAVDGRPWVEIRLEDSRRRRLSLLGSVEGEEGLIFHAAALSFVLEEKTLLGLAAEPDDSLPLELLDEKDLIARAVAEREERARKERMRIKSSDPSTPWADYVVTNAESGKSYRVALRGMGEHESYCSCPDFRKNHLGLCKHTLRVKAYVQKKFSKARLAEPYVQTEYAVHAVYGAETGVRLLVPEGVSDRKFARFRDQPVQSAYGIIALLSTVRDLEKDGHRVTIYADAEEYMEQVLHRHRIKRAVEAIRKDPADHPLRKELLKAELLPYQLDGVAFAAGAGRAILADDMGLGKTIQGLGVAEFLRRHAGIRKVLVVCPASLKSQWGLEAARFSDLSVQQVLGPASDRPAQYASDCFLTVCNYEQVLRDYLSIERVGWDLIILDEGQRIKNWEAKTSRIIKSLRSPFALVLTGTPMENRLEELFSVVEFIDDRRLGPAYRFLHTHRMVDETGKVTGYRNLDQLRGKLAPVMLRRTRSAVMKELPPRTTEIVRIPPTEEQSELHGAHLRIVSTITRKAYISEMDLLRLQKALLMCRMAADSTFLVDKEPPGYSSKLAKLAEMLGDLAQEQDRKIVLFSEWTTMLNLIEPLLKAVGMDFVRLDGQVPQKKRQALIARFQKDPACRVFLTTNAGSTGINLQAANTVINVDLPWNPALLEQRIGRAHRMGQKRPVQVYLLVTEDTIEDNLLNTLSAKNELALAALDANADVEEVTLHSGMEELKRRLEVLLGTRDAAPTDESQRNARTAEADAARRAELALSGGQLLCATFAFLEKLLPEAQGADDGHLAALKAEFSKGLGECVTRDDAGRPTLQLTLPDDASLRDLAAGFAKFAALARPDR